MYLHEMRGDGQIFSWKKVTNQGNKKKPCIFTFAENEHIYAGISLELGQLHGWSRKDVRPSWTLRNEN